MNIAYRRNNQNDHTALSIFSVKDNNLSILISIRNGEFFLNQKKQKILVISLRVSHLRLILG